MIWKCISNKKCLRVAAITGKELLSLDCFYVSLISSILAGHSVHALLLEMAEGKEETLSMHWDR